VVKCSDVSEKRTASIVRAKEFIQVETFHLNEFGRPEDGDS